MDRGKNTGEAILFLMSRRVAFLCLLAFGGCARPEPAGLDLILVSIDTLRADRLGIYGAERAPEGRAEQPWTLPWLAERGVVWDSCWAPAGKTVPSIGSVLTGLSPLEHGATTHLFQLGASSLVEGLRERGFRTFGRVANRLLGPQIGFDRGFEDYAIRPREFEPLVSKELLELTAPVIQEGGRLFAWAHFMSPHQPYEPPVPYQKWSDPKHPIRANNTLLNEIHRNPSELTPGLRKDIRALYDGEVAYATDMLRVFLEQLDSQYRAADRGGLLENAVVVFFSDHGEELGDRNGYFLHAKSLYAGVTRVPLMILGPTWKPGERRAEPFALQNLMASVMQVVEPNWLEPPASTPSTVGTWMRDFYVLRDSRWTLVHAPCEGRGWGPKEPPQASYPYPEIALFDRSVDPLEVNDLSRSNPEQLQAMLQALNAWFDSQEIRVPVPVGGMDPSLLEELGYAEEAESSGCRPRSLNGR